MQSELTSVIMITQREKLNLENIDDLIDNKYNVFASPEDLQYFISTKFYNHIQLKNNECYESLKTDTSRACTDDCFTLNNVILLPENTRIILDQFLQMYRTLIFPIDYPLLPRIRDIYCKLFESGIVMNYYKPFEGRKIDKIETIGSITLDELKYVFYFLLFGSINASIIFLIETVVFNFSKYFEVTKKLYLNII